MIPDKRRAKGQVDEQALLSVLKSEEMDAATYWGSEVAREQAIALDRYFARPYGDGSEVPNRSQVVTRDIQDAVNWVLPHLLRHFTQNEDLITCIDRGGDDDGLLEDAGEYLRHVLFNSNHGEEVIHDFLFDGFVSKYGVLRTAWDMEAPEPPKELTGLTQAEVLRYAQDQRYEVLAASIDGEFNPADDGDEDDDAQARGPLAGPPPQMAIAGPVPPGAQPGPPQAGPPGAQPQPMPEPQGPPQGAPPGLMGGMSGPPQGQPGLMQPAPMAPMAMPSGPELTFSLKVQKLPQGKCMMEAFDPARFRISRRATCVEDAPYHGGQFDIYLADLVADHPDMAHRLESAGGKGEAIQVSGLDAFSDERLTARFPDEYDNGIAGSNTVHERTLIQVMIEYVRGDFDDDGQIELRRIKRTGDVILENDVVRESEFTMWSPIRVSHRAIGLSLADTLMDIQKIRTVLTRKAMDSLSQSLAPRTAVNKQALGSDPSLLDRLLDHEVGDVIPVDGEPSKVFMPLTTPDVSASAFQAIEYWDRRSEEASGVNRHAMGIQPQAITDTKGGIDSLMAAANSRIEQYARWAATGLERALGKALRLLIEHQQQAVQLKINGRQLKIDPRRWSDEMTVLVHVGMAAETREKKLAYLSAIAAKQEIILKEAGPSNPVVGFPEYIYTLKQMATAMGFRNTDRFFKDLPRGWQPPPQQPQADPKMIAAQGQMQLAQAEAQGKAQLAQAEMQQQTQLKQAEFQRDTQLKQMELQANQQMNAADREHQKEMERAKLEADTAMAARKADIEQQIAQMRADNETAIAQMKVNAETALAQERMNREIELARWKVGQEIKIKLHSNRAGAMNGTGAKMPAGSVDGEDHISGVRFGGQIG